jgi:hypothetical protein
MIYEVTVKDREWDGGAVLFRKPYKADSLLQAMQMFADEEAWDENPGSTAEIKPLYDDDGGPMIDECEHGKVLVCEECAKRHRSTEST